MINKVLGGGSGEVNHKTEYLVCWVSILYWPDLEPEVFVVGWQCLCLLEFPWFVREMFVKESNPLENIWHLCLLEQASISCPTVCSNCQLDGLRKYFFTRFILDLFLFLRATQGRSRTLSDVYNFIWEEMSDIFMWLISIITTSWKKVIPGLPTPILKYDLISTAGYVVAGAGT